MGFSLDVVAVFQITSSDSSASRDDRMDFTRNVFEGKYCNKVSFKQETFV